MKMKLKQWPMTKNISRDCYCKFNSTKCNSNQKWNNKTCQHEGKNYFKRQNIKAVIPAHLFIRNENSKYLKIITDTSVIVCDEIIDVMDIVSTKMVNKVARNTVPINSDSKKMR